MKSVYYLGYLVCLLNQFVIGIFVNNQDYIIIHNTRSLIHSSRTITAKSLLECIIECFAFTDCQSVNYRNGICEMINVPYSNCDSVVESGWSNVHVGKSFVHDLL